jgi:hypothetical protein
LLAFALLRLVFGAVVQKPVNHRDRPGGDRINAKKRKTAAVAFSKQPPFQYYD